MFFWWSEWKKNVCWSRPLPNNIILSHLLIKNDLYIDWMKILPKDIFWWSLYSSIYMKTSSRCILCFYVGLFNCCSIWEIDICGWYLDSSIPHSWYNTTGSVLIGRPALSEMTPWLRSSVLLEPSMGTGRARLMAVSHSKCDRSSIHSSMMTTLGNLK